MFFSFGLCVFSGIGGHLGPRVVQHRTIFGDKNLALNPSLDLLRRYLLYFSLLDPLFYIRSGKKKTS